MSYHMSLSHLYVFSGEMFISIFYPLLIGYLFFFNTKLHELMYILGINPLLVASFANIFSHSDGCLFILLMVSLAMQKLLSLIRSYSFIFIFITLGGGLEKILLQFMLNSVLCFPLRVLR